MELENVTEKTPYRSVRSNKLKLLQKKMQPASFNKHLQIDMN